MGQFQNDWPALRPRINEMRSKGMDKHTIASALGISPSTYDNGLRYMRDQGMEIVPVTRGKARAPYLKTGPALAKLLDLLPQGMSCAEMADATQMTRHSVYYLVSKKLEPAQKAVWERACYAKRGGSFAAALKREQAPYRTKVTNVKRAEAKAEQFEGRRFPHRGDSHPAMPVGGLAWAAIWGGNPPPYPYELMNGGLR